MQSGAFVGLFLVLFLVLCFYFCFLFSFFFFLCFCCCCCLFVLSDVSAFFFLTPLFQDLFPFCSRFGIIVFEYIVCRRVMCVSIVREEPDAFLLIHCYFIT